MSPARIQRYIFGRGCELQRLGLLPQRSCAARRGGRQCSRRSPVLCALRWWIQTKHTGNGQCACWSEGQLHARAVIAQPQMVSSAAQAA